MKRIIPAVMASQHPDHARKPYWCSDPFIRTQQETEECYRSFSELFIPEYKWDWEGKFVDESVIERLISEHFDYFKTHPLGKEKFLTFRLPNPNVETEFRIGRALMGILSAASLAKQVGLHSPPIFEVILPMTESATQMMDIQEAFREITTLKHKLYRLENRIITHIELIPLFEEVSIIINSTNILNEYIAMYKKKFGNLPEYIRPYIARSDPALNAGIVPTLLAVKIALSNYRDFERKTKIKLYPIIGTGSLPFRGGLTPLTVKQFVREYKGVRTALLQSAFRYDYQKEEIISAVSQLKKILPHQKAVLLSNSTISYLEKLIPIFEQYYKHTIENIASTVNVVASYLPKRRERVQHTGLFGYSRGIGRVKLPRTIGFTAALYSIGIPPEIIGTGRGIRDAKQQGLLSILENTYINLKTDLKTSGRFLNKKILLHLSKKNHIWCGVLEDVKEIEHYLGEELAPYSNDEKEHFILVERIYSDIESSLIPTDIIYQASLLRRSLG